MSVHHVEIGVGDLDRSVDFYRSLLGARPVELPGGPDVRWLSVGSVLLKLVLRPGGDLSGWRNDNLQRGVRHLGFKVGDVDAQAERVRDAGVPFTLPPTDALGGVRIAFFQDPDGTHLEFVDNHLTYTTLWSREIADRERLAARTRPRTAGPIFDHVAVTVADLDTALTCYRDGLGFEPVGQVTRDDEPDGFVRTYLHAGNAVLELFSFTSPVTPGPRVSDSTHGVRHVAVTVDDPERAAERLLAAGAARGENGVILDPDGVPLTPITR
ncbi:VOC family protein [Thermostaphylospora chromogena]|uniref:VOC domain-containing protein n=1 Tax=Thermostaphylospora chromogena TaxID=35622 RepID=A0A1H1BKU8_9ACTN|nr:VOC family protein [Thermostaphylospora chromogena]SDQ52370.1 hypothetical protein SAMN04489764_1007 [Thermostaphylospora chromogena]